MQGMYLQVAADRRQPLDAACGATASVDREALTGSVRTAVRQAAPDAHDGLHDGTPVPNPANRRRDASSHAESDAARGAGLGFL